MSEKGISHPLKGRGGYIAPLAAMVNGLRIYGGFAIDCKTVLGSL